MDLNILSALFGFLLGMLGNYYSYRLQTKRDRLKFENERLASLEEQEFKEKKSIENN